MTLGVLEVNPEVDSIRAQRGRARSSLFSRVFIYFYFGSREFSRSKKFHQKSLKKFFDTFQLVVQEVDILPNLVNFVQYPSPLHPLINTSHTHISTKTSKPGPADFRKKLVRGIFGILETPSVHCMPFHGHAQPFKASN